MHPRAAFDARQRITSIVGQHLRARLMAVGRGEFLRKSQEFAALGRGERDWQGILTETQA
jgi:hypothetical protein